MELSALAPLVFAIPSCNRLAEQPQPSVSHRRCEEKRSQRFSPTLVQCCCYTKCLLKGLGLSTFGREPSSAHPTARFQCAVPVHGFGGCGSMCAHCCTKTSLWWWLRPLPERRRSKAAYRDEARKGDTTVLHVPTPDH